MKGRVFGSADLILSHYGVGVEGQPLARALLGRTAEWEWHGKTKATHSTLGEMTPATLFLHPTSYIIPLCHHKGCLVLSDATPTSGRSPPSRPPHLNPFPRQQRLRVCISTGGCKQRVNDIGLPQSWLRGCCWDCSIKVI